MINEPRRLLFDDDPVTSVVPNQDTPLVPRLGTIQHYVSYGAVGNKNYVSTCRAAVVTETDPDTPLSVGLCVLNPTGAFFNQRVQYDSGGETPGDPTCPTDHQSGPHRYCQCGWMEGAYLGGTWHSPDRCPR